MRTSLLGLARLHNNAPLCSAGKIGYPIVHPRNQPEPDRQIASLRAAAEAAPFAADMVFRRISKKRRPFAEFLDVHEVIAKQILQPFSYRGILGRVVLP